MRYLRAYPALRYGLSAAIVNAALLGVDRAIRALNPAIIQSPQGRHMPAIVMLSCVALVTLTIGYLTTRDTGRVTAAQWAGALAVGLPTTGLVIISYFASGLPADNKSLDAYAFIAIVLILAGALAGFLVAALGGLAGRIRYRQAHREQIAERAAARARRPTRKMRARAIAFQALMAAALVAVTMAPIGLTNLAPDYLSQWQGLVASAVALLAGFGLLRFADRADWRGYLYDFFGAILIVSGLIVGIAEITNYALSLLAILGPIIFMWRGVRRSIDYSLGVRAPTVNDPPEIAPVTFRHDGESIVVYPSRRTLALHAAAFVGATLVCGAMAVGFRSAGAVLVLGLGAFILVFLLFCVIPDFARLLRPWPTLTVTSDGIIDRGSGLVTGFGLIPWHEIDGVIGDVHATRFDLAYLRIFPVNLERLLAQQPRLKRPLLRLVTQALGVISIASIYLAQPPVEVAGRIGEYVRSHAPADYLEQEDAGERAPDDPEGPPAEAE